ncbi:Protein kinase superfamily protein [Perilla frutescens var. hirtella]|nr:Protein kinase superfamily protein [Perilla frutescens var. hirtella]
MAPFDGRNDFQDWKIRIECNLTKEKIHKAIFTKIDKSVDDEKLHDMNDSARATILLNLSSTVLRKVSHHRCAKDLWDDLNSLYAATSEESVYALQDQFMNYQMDSSKDVDANMDEFNKLLQDLKLAGDDTHEKYAAQILLGAIPESFSEVKSALKYGGSKVTCNMIVTGLKAKENELKKLKSKPLHNEIICKQPKRNKGYGNYEPKQHANNVYEDDALADGQNCDIQGKGDICLRFENWSMLTLSDVRYVPQLKFNLLSVSKIADKMLDGSVNSLRFKFEKDSELYFIAPRKGDLYVVHAESVPLPVVNVIQEDKTALWHARLGHMSNKGLSILHKNGTFGKDKVSAIPFCEPCVMDKHHKIPLPVTVPYPRKHDFPCLSESSPYATPSEVENLENLDNNLFDFMPTPPVAPSEVEDKVENVTSMPSESENVTYNEAVKSDESDKWLAAMNCEMKSLHDNNTRILVKKWEALLDKIPSEFNPADMGTKCLPVAKLLSCKRSLNFDLESLLLPEKMTGEDAADRCYNFDVAAASVSDGEDVVVLFNRRRRRHLALVAAGLKRCFAEEECPCIAAAVVKGRERKPAGASSVTETCCCIAVFSCYWGRETKRKNNSKVVATIFVEAQVKCYMKQLISSLEHCHSNGVLHRDIKCSNLLIDNEGILKIADFGLASFFDPERKKPMTSRVVTLWYRPPELLLGVTYYSVGVDL